jgi:ribosomal protein S18 acetylase RimI-like enzyme
MPDDLLDGLKAERRVPMWEATIVSDRQAVFVAETDGAIVGFCSAGRHTEDDLGEVYAIYLLEPATGRGYGAGLMATAEDALTERGCREAILWVAVDNGATRRFYEAGGWTLDGGEDTHDLPGIGVPVVRYRKALMPNA